jgi:hypothetical protein
VLREAGDDLRQRHLRQFRRRDLCAGFGQDLDPEAEPRGIELFIKAGPGRPPQIEIEDMRQLRRSCVRDEIDAVFESVRTDDAMQQLRPQLRCECGEALDQLVRQADESTGYRRSQTDCFSA